MNDKNRTNSYKIYEGESQFNGKVGGYFGQCVLSFVIILFTLGLGTPWVICRLQRWRCENMIVDGKQFVFVGKGRKLFWRYVCWSVLSVVTLGIYAFRVPVKIEDWMTEHTHLVRGANDPYLGEVYTKSRFCGTTGGFLRVCLFQFLLVVFTLGLAMPWAICMGERWRLENMIIDGRQVIFVGRGKKLFWRYLGWSLLSIVTLGVWSFWMAVKMIRWETKNTHFD